MWLISNFFRIWMLQAIILEKIQISLTIDDAMPYSQSNHIFIQDVGAVLTKVACPKIPAGWWLHQYRIPFQCDAYFFHETFGTDLDSFEKTIIMINGTLNKLDVPLQTLSRNVSSSADMITLIKKNREVLQIITTSLLLQNRNLKDRNTWLQRDATTLGGLIKPPTCQRQHRLRQTRAIDESYLGLVGKTGIRVTDGAHVHLHYQPAQFTMNYRSSSHNYQDTEDQIPRSQADYPLQQQQFPAPAAIKPSSTEFIPPTDSVQEKIVEAPWVTHLTPSSASSENNNPPTSDYPISDDATPGLCIGCQLPISQIAGVKLCSTRRNKKPMECNTYKLQDRKMRLQLERDVYKLLTTYKKWETQHSERMSSEDRRYRRDTDSNSQDLLSKFAGGIWNIALNSDLNKVAQAINALNNKQQTIATMSLNLQHDVATMTAVYDKQLNAIHVSMNKTVAQLQTYSKQVQEYLDVMQMRITNSDTTIQIMETIQLCSSVITTLYGYAKQIVG